MKLLEVRQIEKIYHAGEHQEYKALRGINLAVQRQEIVCFKGPSGSGKTSLLSVIGCLVRPTSGRVLFQDEIISALPEHFMAAVRRNTFGFVFQRFNLISGLSVMENVMLPAYPNGPDFLELKNRSKTLLKQLDIAELAHRPVEALSGGEAQRTAICRALMNNPQVIIADEPTANLDSKLSASVVSILSNLREQGKTILMSSHDPLVYESSLVDRVIEMRDGEVIDAT